MNKFFRLLTMLVLSGSILLGTYLAADRRLSVLSDRTGSPATATSHPTETPTGHGSIEGSAAFPAGGEPTDLHVCAESTAAGATFCSDGVIRSASYRHGLGYRIALPADTYRVYSVAPLFKPGFKGYHTRYSVDCRDANSAGCDDHTILMVTVTAGQTVGGITADDYYGPWNI